jgi:hypothetical protein
VNYYYTDSANQPRGPVSLEDLRGLAHTGHLNRGTMVAAVGTSQWIPLASVLPDVALSLAGRTDPLAVWSLVLGIAGLVACWLCCGPLLSIPALITGHISLSKIKRDPQLEGRGLAIAGLITGYAAMALFLLYVFLVGGVAFLEGFTKALE